MNIDILVVAYMAKNHLARTLSSIALNTSPGYRLSVYENSEHNFPLSWIWNRFIEESKRPVIALVNPDIVVGTGWDTEVFECMQMYPHCGIAAPLTNTRAHEEILKLDAPGNDWEKDLENARIRSHQNFGRSKFLCTKDRERAPGSCFVIRKSAWMEVGGFDEKNHPFAGNDYDFNQRVMDSGFALAVCLKAIALHYWNQSIHEAKQAGKYDEASGSPIFSPPPDIFV